VEAVGGPRTGVGAPEGAAAAVVVRVVPPRGCRRGARAGLALPVRARRLESHVLDLKPPEKKKVPSVGTPEPNPVRSDSTASDEAGNLAQVDKSQEPESRHVWAGFQALSINRVDCNCKGVEVGW
jgi:hypothetical protein